MPFKRKHRLESSDTSDDQSKKQKQASDSEESGKDLTINSKSVYNEIISHLYEQEDHEGRQLYEMFDVLPSKEEFPVYYDVITNPIDFKAIKKKIFSNQYEKIEELEKDIILLVDNTHKFNEPRSQISKDATVLKRAFISKKNELLKKVKKAKAKLNRSQSTESDLIHDESRDAEESTSKNTEEDTKPVDNSLKDEDITNDSNVAKPEEEMSVDNTDIAETPIVKPKLKKTKSNDSNKLNDSVSSPTRPESKKDDGLIDQSVDPTVFTVLYNMVLSCTDNTGKPLAQPFLRLPLRRIYPDYYEKIKKPLSLTKLRTKIKSGYFSDLNILEKDFNLIFNNALQYYEPGSYQHASALVLQRFMTEKKQEMERSQEYLAMREFLPHKAQEKKYSKRQLAMMLKRGRPKVKKENGEVRTPGSKRSKTQGDEIFDPNDPASLKKRLKQLYSCVFDYKDSEGRNLSTMFQELPNEEEYPDYYKVILTPIDMKTIEEKLENESYKNEGDFINDFEIMFQNARHFNEEGSEIYEDSVVLEKALKKKRRWLNNISAENKSPLVKGPRPTMSPSMAGRRKDFAYSATKCQELVYFIATYTDETGRNLAEPFQRLPSRLEYPDYYQLIKKPIDLFYISSRVTKYTTIEDLEQDLLLMFDNACTYNEPDSQIYKDALTLSRAMFRKKKEINPLTENNIPNVQLLVQKLLRSLYDNVMEAKDEEGRLYSDSLLEIEATLRDNDEVLSPLLKSSRKPVSLHIIGQLLKLGLYKRIDQLQDDMFAIFKKARKTGTTDSEMYEDACELQTSFITERDKLSKDGLNLQSRAFYTTLKSVQTEIEMERKRKMFSEKQEESYDDNDKKSQIKDLNLSEDELTFMKSLTVNDVVYTVGDYAYLASENDSQSKRTVFSVDKIWETKDNRTGVLGCIYYWPEATFHLASRKFLDKELFRAPRTTYIPSERLIGRCYVMNVKEYQTHFPEGFNDEDVYVCESRYNAKLKSFKKIKHFGLPATHIELVTRKEPLILKRSSDSNVSQEDKKEKEELKQIVLTTTEGYEFEMPKHIEIDGPNRMEGFSYYERYSTEKFVIKVGDGVYVDSCEDYNLMMKVNRIFKPPQGSEVLVQGNWCLLPEDTKHSLTQLFYEMECFESNVEGTSPVSKVKGKFAILNFRDYQLSRPTEYCEKDVFLSTSNYNEDEMKTRKNGKGSKLKKGKKIKQQKRLQLSMNTEDEYWYFEQPITFKKRPSQWLVYTGDLQQLEDQSKFTDNEIREEALIMMSEKKETLNQVTENEEAVALETSEKQPTNETEENVNSMEVDEKNSENKVENTVENTVENKTENVDTNDRNIDETKQENKVVDRKDDWDMLSENEKSELLSDAEKRLDERYLHVFHCAWADCEYQYEDLQDLMVHVMEGSHFVKPNAGKSFRCLWRGCSRDQSENGLFNTHSLVVRHIRQVHFREGRKRILVEEKSKFYFPRHSACDDGFKVPSEGDSERPSSHGSSVPSLSPSANMKNLPSSIMPASTNISGTSASMLPNVPSTSNQMGPGFFPPFRMPTQLNQQQLLMQQQIYQQQMLLRGQMLRHHQPVASSPSTPSAVINQPNIMNLPGTPSGGDKIIAPPSGIIPKVPSSNLLDQVPPQQPVSGFQQPPVGGFPQPPPQQNVLSVDQQQTLLAQIQRQQQQIQTLQQQVQLLQQQKTPAPPPPPPVEKMPPIFIAPPASTQKLRHSEVYLRYIEGLRDNQKYLSNWSEQAESHSPTPPTNHLPVHWLNNSTHGYDSVTDALYALRDHMLKDSITLSKLV